MTEISRCCTFDSHAIGNTALRYFKEQRYSQFAVAGTGQHPELVQGTTTGFIDACEQAGESCINLHQARDITPEQSDLGVIKQISDILDRGTGPLAVYCRQTAKPAGYVTSAININIRIPEDLAILGTGNHLKSCLKPTPKLAASPFLGRSWPTPLPRFTSLEPGCGITTTNADQLLSDRRTGLNSTRQGSRS